MRREGNFDVFLYDWEAKRWIYKNLFRPSTPKVQKNGHGPKFLVVFYFGALPGVTLKAFFLRFLKRVLNCRCLS